MASAMILAKPWSRFTDVSRALRLLHFHFKIENDSYGARVCATCRMMVSILVVVMLGILLIWVCVAVILLAHTRTTSFLPFVKHETGSCSL